MTEFTRIEQDPEQVRVALACFWKAMLKASGKGVSLHEISSALITLTRNTLQTLLEYSTPNTRELNRDLMIQTLYSLVTDLCSDPDQTQYRSH